MKKMKLIMAIALISMCTAVIAQTATKTAPKTNKYFVIASHTPEQCMNNLVELKDKGGDAYLSKFYFGCMSGDHTGYAFLDGNSEQDVRNMLPKGEQATAKIVKVEKFTVAQIDKMHKEHTKKK
ncbi:MAG: hypothetical protein D4R97_02355 [Bacteroidetes bacterium]|nr:MAG: hypothetical protein D4R97_02355 [Bacteroidota bacterium]